MCYAASSLLTALQVNAFSSTKDIKEILDSIGIKAEERGPAQQDKLKRKTSMSLTRLLASWPTVAFFTPPPPPGSAAPAAGSAPTTVQEEKDEKELEEWDDNMRYGLFN